jgi:hypothetical protein
MPKRTSRCGTKPTMHTVGKSNRPLTLVREMPDVESFESCPTPTPTPPQTNALMKQIPQSPVLSNLSERCLLKTAIMFAVSELQLDSKATTRTSTGTFRRSSKCGPVSEDVASSMALLVAEVGTRIVSETTFLMEEVDAIVAFSAFRGGPVAEDRKRPIPKICEIIVSVSANASECSNTDMPTSVRTGCCCKAHDKVSVR